MAAVLASGINDDAQPTRTVCLALKIDDTERHPTVARARGDGNEDYIPARSFTVLGYEWQIDYDPDGHHPNHVERYVKLRVSLARTPSPVAGTITASFTFCLVDPRREVRPMPEVVAVCPRFRQGDSKEVLLVSRAVLEASGHLGRDGNCFVQCKMELSGCGERTGLPPRDLGQDLGDLLRSQNGADVTFIVGAASFSAHRLLLTARSPVFGEELAGSLTDETHRIKDMDADTFRAFLIFIYTDTLPPQLEHMDCWLGTWKEDQEAVSMARRLLDAADRYGVERLKVICEKNVCVSVGVGRVAADLVLAERRGYRKLKARCIEFLVASPADLHAVAAAGGFKLLEASCPSVLTQTVTAVAARSCQLLGLGRR
ncbi:BTB/POZ and MATH domain-containing protein 1-like [Triticum aestivum]|uniref:BTB/POZ and MATH domain-containing protein 1-like n=1 Tax=Triticum aestivum TaxID=4565 RepID=UPI001D01E087|nr:BTB/POZ and MATH domain-containing protein 1-like [Triticum aestivum]